MQSVVVVMSTYNGEKYVEEQVQSILNQKDVKVSLIVRDDGSTDSTVSILKKYEGKGALKLVCGENLKPAKSFIYAIKNTQKADYYAFSDQDDVWHSDKLIASIKYLEHSDNSKPNMYCSNLTAVDNNLFVMLETILPDNIVSEYKELLIRSPHIFGCTIVINRCLRDIIVERDVPENFIMHDLWVALIASCCGVIVYDMNSHIMYRQHNGNHIAASLTNKQKWLKRMVLIKNKRPCSIAKQADEFIKYIGADTLEEKGLLEYTKVVANYNKSIYTKLKYIRYVDHNSMNIRQYIFHVLMALLGNL